MTQRGSVSWSLGPFSSGPSHSEAGPPIVLTSDRTHSDSPGNRSEVGPPRCSSQGMGCPPWCPPFTHPLVARIRVRFAFSARAKWCAACGFGSPSQRRAEHRSTSASVLQLGQFHGSTAQGSSAFCSALWLMGDFFCMQQSFWRRVGSSSVGPTDGEQIRDA